MWFKYVRCSLKANFHQQCLGMLMVYMSQDQRLKNKQGYQINFSFLIFSTSSLKSHDMCQLCNINTLLCD